MKVEMTADGSVTLYLPEMDEHYHSVKGAIVESKHVYVETAFLHSGVSPVRLLEIGFGTGLNAFLTAVSAERTNRPVHYTALERYPLECDLALSLGYAEQIAPERKPWFETLHRSVWEKEVIVFSEFTLLKHQVDFLSFEFEQLYDVVYFDAFAPEKQPELWEEAFFSRLFANMSPGGILSTYCAKGEVRRRLQRVGFLVERLPGPPQGKREILRAIKPE